MLEDNLPREDDLPLEAGESILEVEGIHIHEEPENAPDLHR